jgi:uncharacterized phage-associated protein
MYLTHKKIDKDKSDFLILSTLIFELKMKLPQKLLNILRTIYLHLPIKHYNSHKKVNKFWEINKVAKLTAQNVADYFLCRANEAGEPITNLKLQKLLYYAQGYFLAINCGESLFEDEIEAWVHGPVVPNVYRIYKHFRWQPINTEIAAPDISQTITDFLDLIIETFLPMDAYKLELMTHAETPWLEARGDLPKDAVCRNTIKIKEMQSYFSKLIGNE